MASSEGNTVTSATSALAANSPEDHHLLSKSEKSARAKRWFYVIWAAIGFIILVGVAVFLLRILSVPVSMLIWTLVFVFCLRGIVNGFSDKGMNRTLATTLAYVIMFAVIAGVCVLIFSPMFGLNVQFANLVTSIPDYMKQLDGVARGLYSQTTQLFGDGTVENIVRDVLNSFTSWASSLASGAANMVVDAGTAIGNTFMAIGFALVIAFWILLELPAIGRETKRLINPKHYDDAKFMHIIFTRIMGGYIKGTFLQCLIIGVCCGILFAVVGVPNAPALGVITGVLNIIPIVGPWLGGAAAAITAIFVSPITAVIVLGGTIVIQQFVYTFISPKIMAESVDIHPALTLVAMMVGSALGGAMSGLLGSLVGMLFAIPAIAVIKSCFVYYFEKSTGRQLVSEDGVFFRGVPGGDDADPLKDATNPSSKLVAESTEAQKKRLKDFLHRKK